MTNVHIRPAGPADATAFSAITGEPHETGRWTTLESAVSVSLIAECNTNTPVGFLETRRSGDDIEIMMLATHPLEQRQGIASALLHALFEQAGAVTRIILEVGEDNVAARRLYASNGFLEIARRSNYYSPSTTGRRSDALLLARRGNHG